MSERDYHCKAACSGEQLLCQRETTTARLLVVGSSFYVRERLPLQGCLLWGAAAMSERDYHCKAACSGEQLLYQRETTTASMLVVGAAAMSERDYHCKAACSGEQLLCQRETTTARLLVVGSSLLYQRETTTARLLGAAAMSERDHHCKYACSGGSCYVRERLPLQGCL